MTKLLHPDKKHLLYIEDRPMLLTKRVLSSEDIVPVIVRFQHWRDSFPEDYLEETEKSHHVFWVDIMNPVDQEALRFQTWQKSKGIKVQYFLNPSEVAQYFAHNFARHLGLPCLTTDQTIWSRNKARMKDKLREIGLRTADYREVCTTDELIAAGDAIGWPIILKPADDSACRETYLLHTPEAASEIYLHAKHQWIVEEYIDLPEYCLDALVFDGKVVDYYPVMYPAQLLKTFDGAINANISLRRRSPELQAQAEYMMNKYVEGMQVDHGYVHMEYFSNPEHTNIVLGEVGLRMAGSEIAHDHQLAYGFDIYDALIKVHTGVRPELVYTEDRFVGDLLLPIKAGVVQEMTTMDELLQMEGVIGGVLKIAKGQVVRPEKASHISSGYVLVEGSSAEQVHQRMVNILNQFKIVTSLEAQELILH